MKKFSFRLEKVLCYRRLVQDERKRELTEQMRLLQLALDSLSQLDASYFANKISDLEILTIEEIQIRGSYSERLKKEIAAQRVRIEELHEAVEAARRVYLEATREAEVLEKLKSRKREQYEQMISKHEQDSLDELVTQRSRFQR